MADKSLTGKLAVILHADVADSTALVRQNEQLAHSRIQETFQRLKQIITEYQGRVHEIRGDALLAEFERASDGGLAALAFQSAQSEYIADLTDSVVPKVRVGISLGEIIIADNTLTGAGVVLAQRLEQLAEPGGLVIQGAARETIPERFPFQFELLGDYEVKGFDEPVRAYRAELRPGLSIPAPQELGRIETHKQKRIVTSVVAAILLVIAVASLLWVEPWKTDVEPASIKQMALPLPDKPSIAVLAFTNLTGDPGKSYLSDGISENIITGLSRFSQLFVISRQSSFSYKNKAAPIRQVSEELGVRYVLEGSLQASGNKIRVTAQLINAVEGNHVWAEQYERDLDDIFQVQDEITKAIVATLRSNLDLSEYERVKNKPPKSLSAYENWMLAGAHWFKYTPEDNERAKELHHKVIELDPDFAGAYRGLAWVHINGYRWGWSEKHDRAQSLQLAFENARKAVELAPYNHRAHQALAAAYLQAGQLDEAIAAFDRAIHLNPNDASVLASATEPLIYTGQSDKAIPLLEQAIRMNPYHPVWYLWNLGFAQYLNGEYEKSVESFLKMKKMPNLARRQLAVAYVGLGDIDKAKAVIAEFLENAPDYSIENVRLNFKGKFTNPDDLERFLSDLRTAGLPETPPLALPDKPSIAVMPFTNMSPDAEQEYFVDGMTENLITDLSKISGLFVIARNSSFSYKGQQVNVKQVAKDLGVRYLMEGSVQRAGNRVRINAQLIDATTGGHLWAERYDGSLGDIFMLQDQVTRQIVAALQVSLTSDEASSQAHRATDNAEAHDAFLQGWAHYKLGTPEDLARAIPFFEKAVSLDDGYGLSHAALASIFWDAQINEWAFDLGMPSFEVEDRIEEHLDKALESPTPLAHDLQARIYLSYSLFDEAVQEAEKAVALDINDATAHAALANALILSDRAAKGLTYIQNAMRLDPFYPPGYLVTLGAAQFGMENFEEARIIFERAVKRNAESEMSLIYLASTYGHLGRMREAEDTIEAANELRATLGGLGALSLETTIGSGFTAFRGKIDWQSFGTKSARERLRAGLSEIPALTWQYLVKYHINGPDTWAEIKGATEIDLATAKDFHDRGVLFVDLGTETEGQWEKGRVSGAINLPWADYAAKNRFRETSLNEILNKTEEVVFYWCAPGSTCTPSRAVAKAVNWGYQKVYYFKGGVAAWRKAGYPIETGG